MPELPEVETIARGLAKRVTGDAIESVWLGQKKEPLKSTAQEIAAVLEHSRISRVHRMGKHIVFELELTPPPPTNRKKPPRKVRLGEAAGNTTSAVARGRTSTAS